MEVPGVYRCPTVMDPGIDPDNCTTGVSTTVSTAVYGCSLGVIVGFCIGFFTVVLCHDKRNSSVSPSSSSTKSPLLSYHYKFVITSQDVTTSKTTQFLNLPHLQKPFFLDVLKVLFELLTAFGIAGSISICGMLGVWIIFNLVHFAYVISVGVTSRRSEDFKKASLLVFRSGLVYVVIFCSPLILIGAAYSAQQWTKDAWYVTLDRDHFARYLMVCLVLGSALSLTFLLFMGVYSICDRLTQRIRSTPLFQWVVLVSIAHVTGGMVSFALYNLRPWVTVAFMPLALELVALASALFKAASAQDEVKRFLGDVVSLIHGAVTLLTIGLVQDYIKHDAMPEDHVSIYALQIVQIMSTVVCITVTITTDALLIKDLFDVERLAQRHRSATTVVPGQRRSVQDNDKRSMKSWFDTIKSLKGKLVNRDNDITCCICLDVFAASAMLGVARSCGHHFHIDCINEWMKTKSTCPVCREPITFSGGGLRTICYWDLRKIMHTSIGRPVNRLCSINSLMEEENATSNETILDAHFAAQSSSNSRRNSRGRQNVAYVEELPSSGSRRHSRTVENHQMTAQSEDRDTLPVSIEF